MNEVVRAVATLARLLQPLLSLALGLALSPRALAGAARRPVVLKTLPVALIGVPLVAIAVVELLPLGPVASALILLMAVCPGVILINVSQGRDPRRIPVATATAVILMLAGLISLPLGFAVLGRLFPVSFQLGAWAALHKVVLPVLGPLAGGMALRALFPRAAPRLRRVVDVAFKASLACVLVALIATSARVWRQVHAVDVLAVLLVVALSALMGHLAGGPDDADRELAATAVVLGNPALALLVATTSYPGVNVSLFVGTIILIRFVALAPYQLFLRRRRAQGGPPGAVQRAGA